MVTLIDRWLYVQGFTTTALSFISLLINTNEQFCVPYSVNMVGSGSRNTTYSGSSFLYSLIWMAAGFSHFKEFLYKNHACKWSND